MSKKNSEDQSERFKRAAEAAGVELDEEQLKRALRKMKERPEKSSSDKGGDSLRRDLLRILTMVQVGAGASQILRELENSAGSLEGAAIRVQQIAYDARSWESSEPPRSGASIRVDPSER